MSEYPWNEKINTFTWLNSPDNPFKKNTALQNKSTKFINLVLYKNSNSAMKRFLLSAKSKDYRKFQHQFKTDLIPQAIALNLGLAQ